MGALEAKFHKAKPERKSGGSSTASKVQATNGKRQLGGGTREWEAHDLVPTFPGVLKKAYGTKLL